MVIGGIRTQIFLCYTDVFCFAHKHTISVFVLVDFQRACKLFTVYSVNIASRIYCVNAFFLQFLQTEPEVLFYSSDHTITGLVC
jgi:hypothetical protein